MKKTLQKLTPFLFALTLLACQSDDSVKERGDWIDKESAALTEILKERADIACQAGDKFDQKVCEEMKLAVAEHIEEAQQDKIARTKVLSLEEIMKFDCSKESSDPEACLEEQQSIKDICMDVDLDALRKPMVERLCKMKQSSFYYSYRK